MSTRVATTGAAAFGASGTIVRTTRTAADGAPAMARGTLVMALVALLALPAAGHAQGMKSGGQSMSDASPLMSAVSQNLQRYQRNLVGSAQEMPADKYGYKPTDQQMTFGHLVLHIAGSNEFMCSSISGEARPQHKAQLEDTSPKDQLVARLKESFDYCSTALAKAANADMSEQVPFFGNRKVSRAAAALDLAMDWADHYGQAAMYLRLNGLLPPSAQRRGGM
ncbi:MAG TPA: DinB family protein [Longimicrobiales bacterium]|nr:DinB family protein [Longimicrobiales bacterium]